MKPALLLCLLWASYCFSQKQYEFDYLLEYQLTLYKDSIKIKDRPFREKDETIKKYYLTNSQKNNYRAEITELDSLHYKMVFKDENGILSKITFLKTDLQKAEFINIDCKYISEFENPFKYQTKNYSFYKTNDTILNNSTYSKYKLQAISPQRIKRKKLGTLYYIIDQSALFHSPLFTQSTAYEEWKTESTLPNGLLIETYFIDYYGQLDSKETLVNYWKTDKKIIIPNNCNHTK